MINFEFFSISSEVTFVAPKFVSANQPFNAYIRTSNLDDPVGAALVFRGNRNVEVLIKDAENFISISFEKGGESFKNAILFDLKVLMKHKDQCHDLNFDIKRFIKKVFIFVQTDKAIYKPEDEVRFRVISLNEELKPFKPNNINVTLIDPQGTNLGMRRNLKQVNDLGLFNQSFPLSDSAMEGKWSLFIQVGKVNTTKTFTVQKYKLPFYEVKIYAKPKVALDELELNVGVEAVYSFGENVPGVVTVEVSNPTYSVKSTKSASITALQNFTFSFASDLGVTSIINDYMPLNVTVNFMDTLNLQTNAQVKIETIQLFPKKTCKIHLVNRDNYTAKIPFTFGVIVEEFEGNIIENSGSMVKASFKDSGSNCKLNHHNENLIINSVASFKLDTDCGTDNTLIVKYLNCESEFQIRNEDLSSDKLILRYLPKR